MCLQKYTLDSMYSSYVESFPMSAKAALAFHIRNLRRGRERTGPCTSRTVIERAVDCPTHAVYTSLTPENFVGIHTVVV